MPAKRTIKNIAVKYLSAVADIIDLFIAVKKKVIYFCMLQGCSAAAVFWLHWFTYRGPGGTADIPRGIA